MAIVGAGMGLAMATAASAALAELSQERSGVGSAVLQALQKTGGPLGTAILGSVLSSAYQARLNLAGLPPAATQVVKESLFAGLAVDVSLVVAAGIAAVGIVLTVVFLPGWTAATAAGAAPVKKEGPLVVTR
jgi:hypothetical protein